MAAGQSSGFFGGLLEGVGTALLDAKQQKFTQAAETQREFASVLLKGLDADPTRETAMAVLPKVAELLHEPIQTLFGLKLGKNPQESPLGGLAEGMAAAYPTRADRQKAQQEAEQFKTDEAIRRDKAKVDAEAVWRRPQKISGAFGAELDTVLGEMGLTQETATDPEVRASALREATQRVTAARAKKDAAAARKVPPGVVGQDVLQYLGAKKKTPTTATEEEWLAAQQFASTMTATREKQQAAKTNAYLANAQLNRTLGGERLKVIREQERVLPALNDLKVLNAQELSDFRKAQASGDPSKLVASTAKITDTLYAKKGVVDQVLDAVGFPGTMTKEEFQNELLKDSTGGGDPAAIKAFVRQKSAPGKAAGPTAAPASGADANPFR